MFPELWVSQHERCNVRFTCRHSNPIHADVCWYHRWEESDGRPWLLFGRFGEKYLLRFPTMADFVVSSTLDVVTCNARPGLPQETIRHLFLDQIFPLLLSDSETAVLHASAVEIEQGTIVLVGSSGAGKSTLAAAFGNAGYRVISDDFVPIRQNGEALVTIASYPGLRLYPDSIDSLFTSENLRAPVAHYTQKQRIPLVSQEIPSTDLPRPIWKIYFLEPQQSGHEGSPIETEALSPDESLIRLVSFTFNINILDRARLSAQFRLLADMASAPIFYRASIRRDFGALPSAVRMLASMRE